MVVLREPSSYVLSEHKKLSFFFSSKNYHFNCFTAFVPRHVGIMKTSESDGNKRLILAISTNTSLFGFFYQKEDIHVLTIEHIQE